MSELLLIDDDQELCELLTSWLSQEGFQVRACHDGLSARKALADSAPAAVVLDVMLPDGSGLELLKQLRNDHPELPVLMLSARGEPLDRILGLELGADDYLAKPCDPRELTARLRAVLRRSHPAAVSTSWNWATCASARCAAWSASMNKSSPLPSPKAACSKPCCANPASPWTNRNWRRSPWAAS